MEYSFTLCKFHCDWFNKEVDRIRLDREARLKILERRRAELEELLMRHR